jgi:hypothetical protein
LPRKKRDGSRVWRTVDLAEQLEWLEDALGWLRADCDGVIRRACRDYDDGTSTGSDGKVSGGTVADDGSENGRVPSMVLARFEKGDPVEQTVSNLIGDLAAMRLAAADALSRVALLKGLDPEKARRLVEEKTPERIGAGHCANPHCDTYCSGARDDRLRAGRCDPCRKWRRSHAGEERPDAVCRPVREREAPTVHVLGG